MALKSSIGMLLVFDFHNIYQRAMHDSKHSNHVHFDVPVARSAFKTDAGVLEHFDDSIFLAFLPLTRLLLAIGIYSRSSRIRQKREQDSILKVLNEAGICFKYRKGKHMAS